MAAVVSPGGNGFTVKPEALYLGSSQMTSLADELDDGLRRIRAHAESVVGATWQGAAAEAFGKEWDEYLFAAAVMVETAREIAGAVRHSAHAYVASEQSRAQALNFYGGQAL